VLVAGTSGSGKTTLAREIAAVLGVPHVEIDSLFHGPGWTQRESFEADVDKFTSAPGWASEWQYPTVRALLVDRADLMAWLDLPRHVVLRQVIRRTLRRRLRREELWNGNVEPPLRTFFTDREHIIRWAWSTHHEHAARVASALERRPDLVVVRLASRVEAERWLRTTLTAAVQPD
jgi:adenylate kinase family enzyme